MNVRCGVLRGLKVAAVIGLVPALTACDPRGEDSQESSAPPPIAAGWSATAPMSGPVLAAMTALVAGPPGPVSSEVLDTILTSGDLRAAWVVVDLAQVQPEDPEVQSAVESLRTMLAGETLDDVDPRPAWVDLGDRLLRAGVEAPPGYLALKRTLYAGVDPAWGDLLDDGGFQFDESIDWRSVALTGVPYGGLEPMDRPAVVAGVDADWMDPDEIVIGVVADGMARAYPRRMLEVHEVINDSLGDARIAVLFCSSCGTATAFHTDSLGVQVGGGSDALTIRSSGLLYRSTRLFVDIDTGSLWSPLSASSLGGPIHGEGTEMALLPVSVGAWSEWLADYPGTTVVSRDGGTGRVYVPDPLSVSSQGRVLVGSVPGPFDAEARMIAVIRPGSDPLVFAADAVDSAISRGEAVVFEGVRLEVEGSRYRAFAESGQRERAVIVTPWWAWRSVRAAGLLWDPSAGAG